MKRSYVILLVICLAALALRLVLLTFVPHPGLNDANHYYNLALRLVEGHGFTLDYLWHYLVAPETLVHPFDFWQPMTGILAAGSMQLFGVGIQSAMLPFVIMGSVLPIVAYAAAREFECTETASLFAAAAVAVLPEFVLNSVHSDTLIPNALFVSALLLFFVKALKSGQLRYFFLSGIFAGLAYWTRGDALLLLPALLVTLPVSYVLNRQERLIAPRSWLLVWIIPVIALGIASPWLLRNIEVLGQPTTPGIADAMYFSDFRDWYSYERDFSWETLLEKQSPEQLIGKRLFEMAAAIRTSITTLDVLLPVAMIGGLLLLFFPLDKGRLLTIAPPFILLGGMYFAYTILMPISNQGGSFKKAFLTLVPLLVSLGAYALDRAIPEKALKIGVVILTIMILSLHAIMLTVDDIKLTNSYLAFIDSVSTSLETLPDTNDDGEIIVMTQDPFMLRYVGYRGVMIPMDDRDTIVMVAQRYQVDYLLMPPARPSLDPIYTGELVDPRFIKAASVNMRSQLYRFDFDAVGVADVLND